jgi:two-component system sensor histidine kinase KdpD
MRAVVSVAAIAAVSAVIHGLDEIAPILGLGSLYLFAVVPIAIAWGLAYAILASILSFLAFNFFFLPPLYTFTLAETSNWVALAVYLVTAIVVSELAARARRRAAEAEQRGREEALLADVATAFLQGRATISDLEGLEGRIAEILKAESARIELGPQREPPPGESPFELKAGGNRVGTLYLREGAEPSLVIRRRFLPALASLLAVAVERERLAREAVEAEALRRSDTIKTAVLQAVSHDLRSPLTAVVTAVETLRSPSLRLQPDDREALLDTIATEAGRLGRLVRDLLDLSRLQAGAARSNREIWTVDELVGQALADLGPDGERVRVTLPTDLPPVATDAAQLRRVLANLIENALKFSPEQERVTVRATATRKEVIVRVVDCGPGIDQSKLDQVFEPFWRADTTGRVGGSGVGLAIAKGFTEANGGRIWAESRPGQGACFAVALPLAPVPAAAATA